MRTAALARHATLLAFLGAAASVAVAQGGAVLAVPPPGEFRNAPPQASAESARVLAFGNDGLADLIARAQRHSPARGSLEARRKALGFGGGAEVERRVIDAELQRVDDVVAEETAHAWLDAQAAHARVRSASLLTTHAREATALVRARVDAGLAPRGDADAVQDRALKSAALVVRFEVEERAALTRLGTLSGTAPPAAIPGGAAPDSPIPRVAPAVLLQRPEMRAARARLESRDASAAELQAAYRETLMRLLDETEAAYAAAISAERLREAARESAATAARQTAAHRRLMEAGRIPRVQWLEAAMAEERARLAVIDAEHAYARSLATLERMLGRP